MEAIFLLKFIYHFQIKHKNTLKTKELLYETEQSRGDVRGRERREGGREEGERKGGRKGKGHSCFSSLHKMFSIIAHSVHGSGFK